MGTERALGKGGMDVEGEQARLSLRLPDPPVVPAHGENHTPTRVSGMKTMPGMAGMKGVETLPRARTAATHHATGDAPAHDMGGMKMGGSVPVARKVLVALITLVMLAGGGTLAARFGDLSMRAGEDMSRMR